MSAPLKQYGYFAYDAEQWGIVIYRKDQRAQVQDEGPYDSYRDAKAALINHLKDMLDKYKQGLQRARKLTKKDFHL